MGDLKTREKQSNREYQFQRFNPSKIFTDILYLFSTRLTKYISVLIISCVFSCISQAAPPFPSHTIEGNSGVLITPTAYLTNPPEKTHFLGLPSVSSSIVFLDDKDLESFTVTENIIGRFELGYAYERFNLGNWPDIIRTATTTPFTSGIEIDDHLSMHNFNIRAMLVKENEFDLFWMPALTFGAHFKQNKNISDVNKSLYSMLERLGYKKDTGTEYTLVASKTMRKFLPCPITISAGIRNGNAIQTGLFGFAKDRHNTLEGNIIAHINDKLAIAAEYRQKPNLLEEFSIGNYDLIKAENDWGTIALGYVINEVTVAGGYMSFGNIANDRDKCVFGIQLKYDF